MAKNHKYTLPDMQEQRSTTGITAFASEIQLNEYDTTSWDELIQDYQKMRDSDCIASSSLEILKLPIMAAPFKVSHPLGDQASDKTKEAIEYLQYTFDNLYHGFDYFKRHMLLKLDNGISMFEKVWQLGADYKGNTTNLLTYMAPIQPTTVYQWYWDDKMNFNGFQQARRGKNGLQTLVDFKESEIMILSNNMEFGDIRGRSVLRPARLYWREKINVFMASSRAATRGAGLVNIMVNGDIDKDPGLKSKVEQIGRTVGNMKNGFVATQKDKVELNLIELKNQQNNMELLNYCDKQMFYNTLTEFLISGIGENGSRAATSEHKSPYELKANSILKAMESALNELSWEMIDNSYLGQLAEDEYPEISMSAIADKDLQMLATSLVSLIQEKGITVTAEDEQYLREQFGLPKFAIDKIEEIRKMQQAVSAALEKKKPKTKCSDGSCGHDHGIELELPYQGGDQVKFWRDLTDVERNVFELESAVRLIRYHETDTRAEIDRIFQDQVKDIARQLIESPETEPVSGMVNDLYCFTMERTKESFRAGYHDVIKEIGKHGMSIELERDIQFNDEIRNRRLWNKCDRLLNGVRLSILDTVERVTPQYLKLKGGIESFILANFSDGQKAPKNDLLAYVIGGYSSGRGNAIVDNIKIIEELTYVAILDQNVCEVCAPMDGLKMSVQEALDHGLSVRGTVFWDDTGAAQIDASAYTETSTAVNPDCLGWLGGNKCRCQLVPTGINTKELLKSEENKEIVIPPEEIKETKLKPVTPDEYTVNKGKGVSQVAVENFKTVQLTAVTKALNNYDTATGSFSEEAKFIIDKAHRESIINLKNNNKGYVIKGTKDITIGTKLVDKDHTTQHEVGHVVGFGINDDKNEQIKNAVDSGAIKVRNIINTDLQKRKDIEYITHGYRSKDYEKPIIFDNIIKKIDDIYSPGSFENLKEKQMIKELHSKYTRGYQDLIECYSGGNIKTAYGHGAKYWKRSGVKYNESSADLISQEIINQELRRDNANKPYVIELFDNIDKVMDPIFKPIKESYNNELIKLYNGGINGSK